MNISRCAAPFIAASRRALAIAATHRVAHRHSADPINEKTAATNQVVPASASDHPGGHVGRRALRATLGVATAMCTLALGLGVASAAQAQVNPGGPHALIQWGDCKVTLGNVAWTGGAAVGGADIICGHYHSYVGATVYLYRYDGSKFVYVRSGGGGYNNWYGLSVQTTPPYCGGGNTLWDDKVTVQVDSYRETFDLGTELDYYPLWSPGWAPGC
jgi:hypothetical protein